jgi:hypothetical protein
MKIAYFINDRKINNENGAFEKSEETSRRIRKFNEDCNYYEWMNSDNSDK